MRIAVFGAGGVGGYFGGRLAQAGHDVTFVARGAHLAALQSGGLRIASPLGDLQLAVRAVADPAAAGRVDLVLFAVKLWDVEAAARALTPVVAEGGVVLPLQNGVESPARVGTVLGPQRVMGGAAYIAARISAPGTIQHTGRMARLRFGSFEPSQRTVAAALLDACRGAGVEAELVDDITRVLWEKFVFLDAMSGTTAIARAPIGVVREDPDLRWLLEAAMRETWLLGRHLGVALADDFVEQQLAFADGLPPEMRSSMLGDLLAGGRLEAPWLCGAVVRMAEAAGVAVPANRAIYAALKPHLEGSS